MNINFEIREECLPYEDLTRRPNILFLQGEKFIDCKTYHGCLYNGVILRVYTWPYHPEMKIQVSRPETREQIGFISRENWGQDPVHAMHNLYMKYLETRLRSLREQQENLDISISDLADRILELMEAGNQDEMS